MTMFWNANETTIKFNQACRSQDLDKVQRIVRIDKEKVDVKQLDEMKTLLKTLGPIRMFGTLERLQEAMKNDPQVEIVKALCEAERDVWIVTNIHPYHLVQLHPMWPDALKLAMRRDYSYFPHLSIESRLGECCFDVSLYFSNTS